MNLDANSVEDSLQLRIFRFGLFQGGDVGVGVFPEGERQNEITKTLRNPALAALDPHIQLDAEP